MKTIQPKLWLLSASTATVVALSISVALAWTGPTQTAPAGNTGAPFNVGTISQIKAGGIWASSVGSDNGYCIGASCITAWPATSTVNWLQSGTITYYNAGNVGIGTASPTAKLDINGYARLAPQSSVPATCDAAHKGTIAIPAISARPCVCNGSAWVFDYNGGACVWGIAPGSQSYSSPGTYTFTVPAYNTLTVQVSGAGGGGVGLNVNTYVQAGAGGYSSFNGSVVAYGGTGGSNAYICGSNGAAGSASGGNVSNTAGGGASGGANTGSVPGCPPSNTRGGAGGYSVSTYVSGSLSGTVTVIVGAGGGPGPYGGTYGSNGNVYISWN